MNYEEIAGIVQTELRRQAKRLLRGRPCPNCNTSPMIILEKYDPEDECDPIKIIKCLNCHKSFVEKLEEVA